MKRLIVIVLAVLAAGSVFAQDFEFVTVSDVVKEVKERFADVESYSASFTIRSTKGSDSTVQSGTVRSLKPNMLRVDYTSPTSQKVVSNGERMWIYIPSLNVVAEQDLKEDNTTTFSTSSAVGLKRLFRKYHYKFASKDQPKRLEDGKNYYTLDLKQKERRSGYKTLRLWVNEDYLITRAEGETSSGKTVVIEFSNINLSANLNKSMFTFEVPSNARTIKNPMISEE
ncbi:MAG: outer membrane lipoprotein chaperone LolA [Spirochaetota bacterium]